MPSGLYADTTLRDLLALEVGDALVASGGGGEWEYEVGIFNLGPNTGMSSTQPTIRFQSEHSREPDVIIMQMVLSESVTLTASDIMSFLFCYIDRFQKVNKIADGTGYYGVVATSNYATSGNYYSSNQLAIRYGFDYTGTITYLCASFYADKNKFMPRQAASSVGKTFKLNTDYRWVAIWLPDEIITNNEDSES